MLIHLPETLYLSAVAEHEGTFENAEQQIAFWTSLGKAVMDNPDASPLLMTQILLARLQNNEKTGWRCQGIHEGIAVRETRQFRQAVDALPKEARAVCRQMLTFLASHPDAGVPLHGELEAFSVFHRYQEAQSFQIAYIKGDASVSAVLLALTRCYMGI